MDRKVLIIADASWQLGAGHVSRCLTFARALHAKGWSIDWILSNQSQPVMSRVSKIARTHTLDLVTGSVSECIRSVAPQWLVIDVPGLKLPERARLDGTRVMLMDDLNEIRVNADVVWNGNVGAEDFAYPTESSTTAFLLGGQYALVDPAFSTHRVDIRDAGSNLLIAFGGSDPAGFTLRVLESLVRPSPLASVTVLVGALNRHRSEIEAAAARLPVKTEVVVDATDVPERVSHADVALLSGGMMAYECMASGLPSLFLPLGPPQRLFLERIEKRGFGEIVAFHETVERLCSLVADPARRRTMAQVGPSLVDGQGANRVAAFLDNWSPPHGA